MRICLAQSDYGSETVTSGVLPPKYKCLSNSISVILLLKYIFS